MTRAELLALLDRPAMLRDIAADVERRYPEATREQRDLLAELALSLSLEAYLKARTAAEWVAGLRESTRRIEELAREMKLPKYRPSAEEVQAGEALLRKISGYDPPMNANGIGLGSCCACGREGPSVVNVILLDRRAPWWQKGGCWACMQCGLPAQGAVAVVCDACLASVAPLRRVCVGPPENDVRVPIERASEPFAHDMSRHPEENEPFAVEEFAVDHDALRRFFGDVV